VFLAEADSSCLRQGDILRDIPFPRLNFSQLTLLSTVSDRSMAPALVTPYEDAPDVNTAQMPMRLCHCAVVTQCCELDTKKRRMPKAHAVALARLVRPPQNLPAEKLASLVSNRDPRGPEPSFLSYFYLEEDPALDGEPWVVDFNQLFSIPVTELTKHLLLRKILEMDDRTRVKFKIRLMTFFGRITDEERAADLLNPWIDNAELLNQLETGDATNEKPLDG
jgi:hypothetical protein